MAKRHTNNEPLSSDQEALLAAIIQFPDEDTPRLMYADWLDENGDHDRAEFIRLQILLASHRRDRMYFFEGELRAAELRAAELNNRHSAEWAREFRGQGVRRVTFARGFVERVWATADAFIRDGETWCRKHPLQWVRLGKVVGHIDRLMAAPYLDAIHCLGLRDNFDDAHLFELTAAPRPGGTARFPNLEVLEFSGTITRISTRGVEALTELEMPRLRGLSLTNTDIDNRGATVVAEAPWFRNLESLTFHCGHIGDAGLAALLTSPHRMSLSSLELSWCRVTAKGLHALADMPSEPPLEQLCLAGPPIRSVNVERLGAALRKHPRLKLHFHECPIPRSTQANLKNQLGDQVWISRSGW